MKIVFYKAVYIGVPCLEYANGEKVYKNASYPKD